jgi:hypothetical protein
VALVEIRRPPHNYFDIALIRELATAFEALDAVYNGDIGFVADVEPEEGKLRQLRRAFGQLRLWRAVMTQHYAMLQRKFALHRVTQGKGLVVLVGQKKAVAIAVRNVSARRPLAQAATCLNDLDHSLSAWLSRAALRNSSTKTLIFSV